MEYTFYIHVAINRATINNARAVRKILKRYASRLPLVILREGKRRVLALMKSEEEGNEWPSAVDASVLPESDSFSDMGEWEWTVDQIYEADGEKGLLDMFLKLARYLEVPLIVQADEILPDRRLTRAKEWTIRPEATEVEIKEIVPLEFSDIYDPPKEKEQ